MHYGCKGFVKRKVFPEWWMQRKIKDAIINGENDYYIMQGYCRNNLKYDQVKPCSISDKNI